MCLTDDDYPPPPSTTTNQKAFKSNARDSLRFEMIPSSRFCVLAVFVLIVAVSVVVGDECNEDISGILPLPYANMTHMVCKPIWNSYVIRFSQSKDNVVTIVLSVTYTSGYVAMGFSRDGMMLNSSAMVGWITRKGNPVIRQYYAEGFSPSQVKHDKGELPLTSIPPFVTVYGGNIHLAYQLKYPSQLKSQPILLAFASKYPEHHLLSVHDDKTTIHLDFSQGSSGSRSNSRTPSNNLHRSKTTHGVLGLLGWGIILPYGAIVARYFKHKEPLWYYLHVGFQLVGFIFAVAAGFVGLNMYNKFNFHAPTHKGFGITAIVLSVLQVLAFFIRPDKDSKHRKYWNWYHHYVGRIALFFGCLNIFLGIQLANAGSSWKIGYGFVLAAIILTSIVLEVLKLKTPNKFPPNPPFPLDSVH
ncbi:hypothetical protein L1987_39286 [Smallanthus sonchifolius]|uniref:Uncharacterized protein n=1 Tax=Smallanthus sonchifolius TaxID=185202 RepID=A0ACB9HMS2_9ASTR|nr:hypothetical protein L1987_39286 [Smallanthus sonchifolius]